MGENLYFSTQTDRSGHLKPMFLLSEGTGGFLVVINLGTVHFLRGRGNWWNFLKCH